MRSLSAFGITYLLLFASTSICQTIEKLDEKYGFRDLQFGQSFGSITNLTVTRSDIATKTVSAERRTDELSLAGVPLAGINYGFFDDKLYMVVLKYKVPMAGGAGITGSREIQNFLVAQYGAATNTDVSSSPYSIFSYWKGQRVKLVHHETWSTDVNPRLAYVAGFITIESISLNKERQSFEAELLRNKRDGF